jgi:methionyl aminopeptidase
MIIQEEDKEKVLLAGIIAAKAREFGKNIIKPGAVIVECLDSIEEFIKNNGADIAFPAQISINSVAAHSCPLSDDESTFKDSDIIKLDLGTHIDGLVADTATTIIFRDNEKYEQALRLKRAADEALANALKIIAPEVTLGDIGMIIEESIEKHNLKPVRNLSGHGLGRHKVHEEPTVPNFNNHDKQVLKENQLIAIEPFATDGQGLIAESGNPTLFSITNHKAVRSNITRDILKEAERFNNMPFTTRWLAKKFSVPKIRFALMDMRNLRMIHEYPPLVEISKGLVSQAEHTVLVRNKSIITTLSEE